MNMKSTRMAATVVAALALSANAKTIYVNCQMEDYTGHDGSTPELALETIQQGVDKYTAAGDIVLVAPGVYNKGLGRKNSNHWWGNSRVAIGNRQIIVRSTNGAAVTHVVGECDPENVSGYGTNAVRCIDAEKSVSSTVPAIFDGFTIRGGSTRDAQGSAPGQGGAVMSSDGNNTGNRYLYFVDCVFSNCQGSANLFQGGTYVRCLFADNNIRKSSGAYIYFAAIGNFINCVFTRNQAANPDGSGPANYSLQLFSQSADQCLKMVNCTFADNYGGFYCTNYGRLYNSLSSVSGGFPGDDGSVSTGVRTNFLADSTSKRVLMAPTLRDWRVRKGSVAETSGEADFLLDDVIVPLPDSIDRNVDFYGNSFSAETGGRICAGAVQTVAEPAGGPLVAVDAYVNFDGCFRTNRVATYAYPSSYPTSYLAAVALPSNSHMLYFYTPGHGTGLRDQVFPTDYLTGRRRIAPSPDTNAAITVSYVSTTNLVYADANSTEATEAQTGTLDHPFSTIQAAIDSLGDSGVIVAAPGVYDSGYGTLSWGGNSVPVKARACFGGKYIRLISSGGPERTVIVGEADSGTADGCGPDAVMTVAMSSLGAVQGFTLTGGHSGSSSDMWKDARGSLYSYGKDLSVTDCIITNNVGRIYAIGTARFERCYVADNTAPRGLFFCAYLISCIVGNNHITGSTSYVFEDFIDTSLYLMSTSFHGDGAHRTFSSAGQYLFLVNSALSGCADVAPSGAVAGGCVASGFSTALPGIMASDPMFASPSPDDPDYRVFSKSPACSEGVSPAEDPTHAWWYLCTTDFNGDPWRFNAERRPLVGALQETVSGGVFVSPGNGGFEVVSGGSMGLNTGLSSGDMLTLGFVPGASRPIAGFAVNGVTNLFDESYAGTPTFTYTADGTDAAIVPIAGDAWYVDAVNGSDTAKFGYNAACAYKTLKAALTNSLLQSGDTVRAMPGTYDEGTMLQDASHVIPSRAVVPSGVTLEAAGTAGETIIAGRESDVTDNTASTAGYAAHRTGLGTNAVRAVYLKSGAVVRGFTLANGHTRGFKDDGSTDHGDADYNGGNAAGNGWVERCILTGGKAFRGGGMRGCTAIDCVFAGNESLYGGGGTSDSRQYGCLFYDNVCHGESTWGGVFYWTAVDGCTVIDSISGCAGGKNFAMRNTLVTGMAGHWDYTPVPQWFTNCVFNSAKLTFAAEACLGVGCVVTNADAIALDDEYRPEIGYNVAIDAADESIAVNVGETDLSGLQRVFNGRRDIGALESDWRPVYAKDLMRQHLTVGSATSNVVENASGRVVLSGESSFTAALAGEPGTDYAFDATVTGGALSVTINGDELVPTVNPNGTLHYAFTPSVADSAIAFLYDSGDGNGHAEISRIAHLRGAMLIVR